MTTESREWALATLEQWAAEVGGYVGDTDGSLRVLSDPTGWRSGAAELYSGYVSAVQGNLASVNMALNELAGALRMARFLLPLDKP